MEGSQPFLESRLSIFAYFEKSQYFVAGLDLFFPAINRFDRRENIRAGSKFFFDQLMRNFSGRLSVRKSAEREQNFRRHCLSGNQRRLARLASANPPATENQIALIKDCGLPGRDRLLRFV